MMHDPRLVPNPDLPWSREAPFFQLRSSTVLSEFEVYRLWTPNTWSSSFPQPRWRWHQRQLNFVLVVDTCILLLLQSNFFCWKNGCNPRKDLDGFVVYNVALGHVFLRVHLFSRVIIILLLLHADSSIYHPRCILFFSQYFSFLCQYLSSNAPYSFICHQHCIMFFSQHFSFSLSATFH